MKLVNNCLVGVNVDPIEIGGVYYLQNAVRVQTFRLEFERICVYILNFN